MRRVFLGRINDAGEVAPDFPGGFRLANHLGHECFRQVAVGAGGGHAGAIAEVGGVENIYTIVGVDETDTARGRISWISPLARAVIKSREGDTVRFQSPLGIREIDIISVVYGAIE